MVDGREQWRAGFAESRTRPPRLSESDGGQGIYLDRIDRIS